MDWHLLGNGVVTLECALILAWLSRIGVKELRKLPVPVLIAFLSLASGTSIVAQKTNWVNNIPPVPPRECKVESVKCKMECAVMTSTTLHSQLSTLHSSDVARGWRVESVATNETVSYTMPSNASYVGNWHVHGARSSFGNNVFDFGAAGTPRPTSWSFPLGTNGAAFSSFWYFVDGRIRPTPKDAAHEICAVGVPMSAVPGQSRLWALAEADDSRVLTWENFFLGGDTNAPVNAQIRLFANGDFTTRSNNVETVCRRVNPDDWDGDGLANEKDENPLSYDGDFFGVANAMPTNANLDAYYQLDVAAAGALDFATIRVTCDGPSDLGDHVIIARTNQVCHVPLLAGATYAVESDLPIAYSAVSSEYAHIITNSATNLTVSLPLEFSLVQIQMRNGGDICNYGISSVPVNVFANVFAVSGGCCSPQVLDGMMRWVCSPECTCGGETHGIATTALWEGYSKDFIGYVSCGCGVDAPDPALVPAGGPYAASVSASFSKDAVIFENAYENKPGELVFRRSTASKLTIHANGGANGGALSFSASNLGKLQKNSGPVFPQQAVAVPVGQSITYVFNYVGIEASAATNDVVVTATLSDNQTSEAVASSATTTVVRVELEARYAALANSDMHRHVFGVLEDFFYRQYPVNALMTWHFAEGDEDIIPMSFGRIMLPATTNQTSNGHCEFHVSHGNVAYTNTFQMVLPQIEVRNPRCNENLSMVRGEAGWLLLHFDKYVGPSYVSFHGVDFQEIPDESGNCPHEGYYSNVAMGGYLSHCELAGAGTWNRLRAANNYLCSDRVGRAGRYDRPWTNGWKEWPIPIGWGIAESLYAQFDRPPTTQKFILTSGGTFTIRKFGFWATRDTSNHITQGSAGNE